MNRKFHFSIDDVFWSLLQVSDWDIQLAEQPMFGFLERLHRDTGLETDLYLFARATADDGRVRSLKEVTARAGERLCHQSHLQFGPHALDYATAPHAQSVEGAKAALGGIYEDLIALGLGNRISDWVRLHYFSERYELAELFRNNGTDVLLTTDKPAIAYRLAEDKRAELENRGHTSAFGMGFVTSHLRLEFFADDADDPVRFCARMDEALARHGFVTVFTHEVDLSNSRVRKLATAAAEYAQELGLT